LFFRVFFPPCGVVSVVLPPPLSLFFLVRGVFFQHFFSSVADSFIDDEPCFSPLFEVGPSPVNQVLSLILFFSFRFFLACNFFLGLLAPSLCLFFFPSVSDPGKYSSLPSVLWTIFPRENPLLFPAPKDLSPCFSFSFLPPSYFFSSSV